MTVSTLSNKVVLQGNSSTTSWPFPFRVDKASYLSVIVTDANGDQQTISPSLYSIAGVGNKSGGSVTYPLSGDAVPLGSSVTVLRSLPLTQLTDITNQSGFYPDVHEAVFDALTMMSQQLAERQSRAVSFPVSDDGTANELPAAAARLGKAMVFDESTGAADTSSEPYVEPSVAADNAKHVAEELDAALPLGSGLGFFLQDGSGAIGRTFQNKGRERKSWGDFVSDLTGATDVTAGVQAALAWVSANGHELVGNPTDRLLFSSALTVPFPAQIDMRGGRFVAAASMTAGYAVTIKNINASVATNPVEHRRMNIGVQGPYGGESISKPPNLTAAAYNQLDGILIDGSVNQISDVDLDFWVEGFRDGIVIGGTNTYLQRLNRIHLGKCWRRGLSILPGTNAGENLSVNGGVIFNCVSGDGTAIGIYGSGLTQTSLYLSNVSIDYCDNHFYWNAGDGQLAFNLCPFENGSTNPFGILDSTGYYAQVSLVDCTFVHGGATGYLPKEPDNGRAALFKVTGSGTAHFRIVGGDLQSYGYGTTEIVNVTATGVTTVAVDGPLITVQVHQPPLVSSVLNRIRNAGFATADFTGWQVDTSSGQTLTVDAVGDGTYRFKIVGTNAASSGGISQLTDVKPGQRAIIRANIQTSGVTSGAANINVRFFDHAGNTISVSVVDGTGSADSPVLRGGSVVVPPGAATMRTDLFGNALVGTAWFGGISTCVV